VRYSVLLPAAVADTDSAAVQYWVDTVWEDEDGLVVVRDQWYPEFPNQDHLTMMFVTFHITLLLFFFFFFLWLWCVC